MLADEKCLTYILVWRDQLPTGGKGKLALWSKVGSCMQADVLNHAFSWGRGNFIPQVFRRCRDILKGKNLVLSCNILWQKSYNVMFLFFWKKNLGPHRGFLKVIAPVEKTQNFLNFGVFDAPMECRDVWHRKKFKFLTNNVLAKIKWLMLPKFAKKKFLKLQRA